MNMNLGMKIYTNADVKNGKSRIIKKLFKYLKQHIFKLILIIFLSIASVTLTIFATQFLKQLTGYISDAATTANSNTAVKMSNVIDMKHIANLCFALIGMYAAAIGSNFLQSFLMAGINQKIVKKMRRDISQKINKVPLNYFDTNQFGDTLSRITNDVDTVGQCLNQAVSTTISSVVQLIIVVIVMFATNWQMSFTAIAVVPVSLILMMLIMKFSRRYFRAQQKLLGKVNGIVEETYSGQLVVKAFCAEEKTLNEFNKSNIFLKQATRKSQILSTLIYPINSLISKIGYIAICVVGGILASNGKADIATLAAFLIYINLFQNSINQIAQLANVLQSLSAAAGRVFEFLEEAEEESEDAKAIKLISENIRGNVEFKNVKFGYEQNKTIINDFSIEIKAGQKVAIVGPTGAGKTTLVNLLMRFYEINSGDILIDGISIKELKREQVRELFSMVLQDTWLFDGSVKENLVYVKQNVTNEQINMAVESAGISHFISALPQGLDSDLNSKSDISSGQKQLLTIARAMLDNAPMMILDEATSNVDTRTESLIQQAMDKLTAGKTSFVIAHRLSTIKNADIILVLKDGDIVESGNHYELLEKNGHYAELYKSQFSLNA